MVDVARIRRAAEKRIAQGRVGMVLSCEQILALIERGDRPAGTLQDVGARVIEQGQGRCGPDREGGAG